MSELSKWFNGLSPRLRVIVLALFAGELVAIAAAERDIQRRPSAEVRGRKLVWRLVALNNFVGPAAYFKFGRRPAAQ
jgi:hypothetical protein